MPKIDDDALLGDLHTAAALVSTAGFIDRPCPGSIPRRRSPCSCTTRTRDTGHSPWRCAGNTPVLDTDGSTADDAVRGIDFGTFGQ
jgi:hypothetical protein